MLASQVSGLLTNLTADVWLSAAHTGFDDIPPGESRMANTTFTLQTSASFPIGTPIHLQLVLQSALIQSTNYLRILTGIPAATNVFTGPSALADSPSDESVSPSLSVLDLDNLEPLWIDDNHGCLLKSKPGKYLYWTPNAKVKVLANPHFLAHRLTRHGTVVGRLDKGILRDEFDNLLPWTAAATWTPGDNAPVELTSGAFTYPDDGFIQPYVGTVLERQRNPTTGEFETVFLGCTGVYPQIGDAWDQSGLGKTVGAASVYVAPTDFNQDGTLEPDEIERSVCEHHQFANRTMSWWNVNEWGLSAGYAPDADRFINYNVLVSSAAMFDRPNWSWIGPVSFVPGCSTLSIALLINDAGTVAGYGATSTGNPTLDAIPATQAFRWSSADAAFTPETGPVVTRLGTLPNDMHSFPRALNQASEIVGFSDNAATRHAVVWEADRTSPRTWAPLNLIQAHQAVSAMLIPST